MSSHNCQILFSIVLIHKTPANGCSINCRMEGVMGSCQIYEFYSADLETLVLLSF